MKSRISVDKLERDNFIYIFTIRVKPTYPRKYSCILIIIISTSTHHASKLITIYHQFKTLNGRKQYPSTIIQQREEE